MPTSTAMKPIPVSMPAAITPFRSAEVQLAQLLRGGTAVVAVLEADEEVALEDVGVAMDAEMSLCFLMFGVLL